MARFSTSSKTITLVLITLFLPSIATADEQNIRVALSRSMSKAEVTNNPAVEGKKETTKFCGHIYKGKIEFFNNTDGTFTVVNTLPMEEYLVGLVASEMPTEWPIETIKAQAVAARTYASFQKQARSSEGSSALYDVEATVIDQVYEGAVENERVRTAVEETNGEVLTKHGNLIKSFFNSACGGQTETAQNVWGEKNIFKTVIDPYCSRSPNNTWAYSISKANLAGKIKNAGFPAETIESLSLERRKNNPRVATITIDTGAQTIFLQGSDFRRIVGYDNIKSTWFDAKIEGDTVKFNGRGYGHGVGLCQWGAKGMAEKGKTYREILKFYYPGVKIQIITNNQAPMTK